MTAEPKTAEPKLAAPITENAGDPSWYPPEPPRASVYTAPHLEAFAANYEEHRRMRANLAANAPMPPRRLRPINTGLTRPVPNRPAKPMRRKGFAGVAATLTLLAIGTGTGLGYLSAKPGLIDTASIFGGTVPGSVEIAKPKPVAASSHMKNIEGRPDMPIQLGLKPASTDAKLAYEFTGMPDTAYLTAGVDVGDGKWRVEAQDITVVGLVVPETSKEAAIDLHVSAIEPTSGAVAFPAQQVTVAIVNPHDKPSKKTFRLPVGAKAKPAIAPMQAAGDPGVAGEEKVSAQIVPAAAPPESAVPVPEPKKPTRTLKNLLFGD